MEQLFYERVMLNITIANFRTVYLIDSWWHHTKKLANKSREEEARFKLANLNENNAEFK